VSRKPSLVSGEAELRRVIGEWRRERLSVALVPTMGNLHEGHASLVGIAAARADRVVVSIFVNPLQFGPGEDYASYPRTLEADMARLAGVPCDLVFVPGVETMYPGGREQVARVEVPGVSAGLCGESRPGHFTGVATVVAKLFNLVTPDLAVFGEKDFQQLAVIGKMTRDLCFPVEIVAAPTVREPDGLAMSSRNAYLSPEQRARAPALYRALVEAAENLKAGSRDFVALQHRGMDNLRSAGLEPDYFEVRRREDLAVPEAADARFVVLAAAKLGRARLIDNLSVDTDAGDDEGT